MTQVNRHLSLKLRLERRLARELDQFSRLYLNAYAQSAEDAFLMLSPEEWSRRLAQILAQHYARVLRSVQTGAIMNSSERLEDIVGQDAGRLVERAMFQARRVVDKLDALAAEALAHAMQRKDASGGSRGGGTSVTLIGYMQRAWRKFARSIGVIANMNTQEVAEEAAAALRNSGLPPFLTEGGQVVVEWRSLLDGRERKTHNAAHGQRAELPDGVFTVGGASLRFPGDSGLGAPLKEIINCRCFLRTIWIKPDGSEEIIEDGVLNPSYPTRTPRRPGANPNAFTRTRPTPAFTFGVGKGPWRGVVILGNGQRANYTVGNGGATIRVGGKPVASAPIKRDGFGKWTLGRVTTAPGYEAAGIDRMLQASVEASNRLPKP